MSPHRTLIVGDVHGCADELDSLLRVAGFTRGDRLVFVGDMVAKGPDSAGVVARARELGALAVLGNHEMPLLAYHDAIRRGEEPPPMKATHREAARSLRQEDAAWLRALPFWRSFPELSTIVVHAGLVPGVALEDQPQAALITMRSLRANGSWSNKAQDGEAWVDAWKGPERVVFGHDAIRGLQQTPLATGLDTGCVYGRELTALELPSGRLYRVAARKAWCAI